MSPLGILEGAACIAFYYIVAVGSDPENDVPRWMGVASSAIVGLLFFGGIAVWLFFLILQSTPAPSL